MSAQVNGGQKLHMGWRQLKLQKLQFLVDGVVRQKKRGDNGNQCN